MASRTSAVYVDILGHIDSSVDDVQMYYEPCGPRLEDDLQDMIHRQVQALWFEFFCQRRSYIWGNRGNCLGKICSLCRNRTCFGEKAVVELQENK